MKKKAFEILSPALLHEYEKIITGSFLEKYQQLTESELSINTFSFYTSVSAVFSSKIEGENTDLDSYVKHKRFGIKFLPGYTVKIDDLYNAYQFAKTARCNQENIELTHQILTQHILPENRQRKIRTGNMYVTTEDGRIEYVAASPYAVVSEMKKFYNGHGTIIENKITLAGNILLCFSVAFGFCKNSSV